MSTICDLINKYREPYMSKLSTNAQPFKTKKNPISAEKKEIKLLSWSIYHKLYNKLSIETKDIYNYKNKKEKRIEINEYITTKNPDILFTQESKVELGGYDIYNTISNNFKICIYLKKNIFNVKQLVRYHYQDNKYIRGDNVKSHYFITNKNIKRPIIAIKLQHNSTKQFFIFINVLFQIEYENNSQKTMTDDDYSKFITTITNIIGELSNDKDKDEDNIRIIIAGDFSGISNFLKKKKIEDLKIKIGIKEITLYLKQNQNTCCGSETSQFKPDKIKTSEINDIIKSNDVLNHNSDLFYDSHNNTEEEVTVDTDQKISNHHPIIGTISVLPVTESHAGGNIKHTNLTIKSKKLKITKKLKTTKKKNS